LLHVDNSVEAITPRLTAKFITNATSALEMDAVETLKQTIFDLEMIDKEQIPT